MMTVEQLQRSILQLAMQGKLVEQRLDEGTGEELYREILTEKNKQIKEGIIKKGKILNEITDDIYPFDIPESWKWVRLGDISSYAQSKQKVSPKDITPDMWSLDLEDIEKGTGKILNYVLAKDRKIQGDKVRFKKGNILYSKLRPYLLKILIAENDGITTPELVPFNIYGIKDSAFFLWYLRSPYVDNAVNCVSYGVKMPRVGTDTMVNLLVPLPPLAEQKRIVGKLEELMPFVEQYAVASTRLKTLNVTFTEMMKKSILQEAVQGKLVSQDSNDEPANLLVRKIVEEKKRLIKEGKLKKQKSLPEISEDEIPFDIPESWEWVRLGNIVSILGDGIHGTPKYDDFGEYFFVNGNNLSNGRIEIKENTKRVNRFEYEKYKKKLDDSSILVSINGTIGNIAFYNNEPIMLGKSVCYFNLINPKLKPYMFWLIKSDYFMKYAFAKATGTTIKNVSLQAMSSFLVPLPSIAEQKRIVAKVEEILPLCEGMK